MSRKAVVAVVALASWAVWAANPSRFTVTNESGQTIRAMTVVVGGRTYRYADIPPGGRVSGSFRTWNEETCGVRGELADGTGFAEPCGYVVWEDVAPTIDIVVGPKGWVGTRPGGAGQPR